MKRLFVFLFLCFYVSVNAQPPTFLGPAFRMDKREQFIGFLKIDSTDLKAVIRSHSFLGGPVSVRVKCFDRQTLAPGREFDITPETLAKSSRTYLHLLQAGTRIVLVTLEIDNGSGEGMIMAFAYGSKGEKFDPVVLDTVRASVNRQKDIHISMPENSDNFVLSLSTSVDEGKGQELRVKRFDSTLQCTARKVFEFENDLACEQSDRFYNGQSGFAFIQQTRNLLAQAEFSGEPPVSSIWVYDFESRLTREIEIRLPGRRLEQGKIGWHADNWYVSGYYSNAEDRDPEKPDAAGIVTVVLDSAMQIRSHSLVPFTDLPVSGQDFPSRIREMQVLKFAFFGDSSFAVIGESRFREREDHADLRNASTGFTETFYYETIVVCSYDRDCNPLASIAIPKEQISVNDEGTSASFAFRFDPNNTMDFLFWDHPKNRSLPLLAIEERRSTNPFLYNDLVRIRLTTDSNEGYQSTRELIFLKNQKLQASPPLMESFGGFTYLFVKHRREARIVRVGMY